MFQSTLNWEVETQPQLHWYSLSPEQAMFESGKSKYLKYHVLLLAGNKGKII
jgi:hypothetical protein